MQEIVHPSPPADGTSCPSGEISYPRYQKCIHCGDFGKSCLGPDFLILPIAEFRAWVRLWQRSRHLTVDECARVWKEMPKSTAARFLSDEETDFKYQTVWAVAQGIVAHEQPGSPLGDKPCPASSSEILAAKAEWEGRMREKEGECRDLGGQILSQQKSLDFMLRLADQRRSDIESKNKSLELYQRDNSDLQQQLLTAMRDSADREAWFVKELGRYRKRVYIVLAGMVLLLAAAVGLWGYLHNGLVVF